MTINTTLDSFLYANTVGFNPDYGKITPRQSGSLISREINQNMEKLISIGHSIAITENSETTAIEYNASFVIKTEDATLKLGTAFQGCQVTIVFTENGFIEYTKAEGNTKEKYKKNTIKKITYNGLYWIDTTPLQIPETNLTCDTAAEEEFKIVKIETILQQGKIPNNIELNIDFTNANSFGETTAATPTYPKLKITNAADEELGIYTICDSRGHYAGKGCWNSGDTMTFKIKGTKACITNSDVRETTSDYTIYSDGQTDTDAQVGTLICQYKKVSMRGYLYCDGSTYDKNAYPALYLYLGSDVLPDYRECVMVGAEKNTTDTIANHDVYTEGQFKDDQLQDHNHNGIYNDYPNGVYNLYEGKNGTVYTGTVTPPCRFGSTTHGKQKAVYVYIKANGKL